MDPDSAGIANGLTWPGPFSWSVEVPDLDEDLDDINIEINQLGPQIEKLKPEMQRLKPEMERLKSQMECLQKQLSGKLRASPPRRASLTQGRDQLRQEHQLETDYLRLRAFPFAKAVAEFIEGHERVYVVEQNRDAQMHSLLRLDVDDDCVAKLRRVRHYNGLPVDARSLTDSIVSQEGVK